MQLDKFTFHAPTSLEEATELYAHLEGVKLKAGGTFLINALKRIKKRKGRSPQNILSLSKIPELKKIDADDAFFSIGSMVTMQDIIACKVLKENASVLQKAAAMIGNTPIRNMATIGGNLTCRYTWTEMPAVLLALDARLHFQGPDKKEETVMAEDFFGHGAKTEKILTKITIKRNKQCRFAYQRATRNAAVGFPLLAVCLGGQFNKGNIKHTRVSINNGVSFAVRDKELEHYLEAKEDFSRIMANDLPGLEKEVYTERSDEYKKHMFLVCLKRAIEELKI